MIYKYDLKKYINIFKTYDKILIHCKTILEHISGKIVIFTLLIMYFKCTCIFKLYHLAFIKVEHWEKQEYYSLVKNYIHRIQNMHQDELHLAYNKNTKIHAKYYIISGK